MFSRSRRSLLNFLKKEEERRKKKEGRSGWGLKLRQACKDLTEKLWSQASPFNTNSQT
ncbi:MAG: hypothetical protein SWX82_22285 [Cyanobacteriota bacterium]|nr:hypothetical protein [Cyanobacteriota bacterium]